MLFLTRLDLHFMIRRLIRTNDLSSDDISKMVASGLVRSRNLGGAIPTTLWGNTHWHV